jgi:hypothetical protein
MFRFVCILCVGITIGYLYGFKDAKRHDQTVFNRWVDKIGGVSRDRVSQDLDTKYRQVGH